MTGVVPNNAMSTQRTCGRCGAVVSPSAPDGLCVSCLLDAASEPELELEQTQLDRGQPPAEAKSEIRNPKSEVAGLGRFGDYELLDEIARGGMGVVYRARQVSLDRIVAVKMLLFGPLASPETIQRFRIEAAAAGSLQHPNIVSVHEVGLHDGQHFFAMEYVAGRSLSAIVKDGPLPPKRAATYLKTIAEAIHYAHERGILHRDLKPSNVLIDPFDQPKVTDFGLAKRLETEIELTLSGQLLGSPNYMPPEQAAAKRGAVGKRSDVYALGAILYHLLTGRPPFVAPTVAETLHEVLNTEPVSPRVLNPGVPRDLETICLKCLEKDPAKRYQTAASLAEELARFVGQEPIQARPVGRTERAWRWCRRTPLVASLGAATVVLFLAVGIGSPIAAYRINTVRNITRQNLYAADMRQLQQAWESGNTRLAVTLLEAQRPRNGEVDLRGFEWRYWSKICQGEQLFTFHGHTTAVARVTVSRDGRLAASTSGEGTVRLWDVPNRREAVNLPISWGPVAFSPDGQALASVGPQGEIVIWDVANRRELANLARGPIISTATAAIAFSPDNRLLAAAEGGARLASSSSPSAVKIWDLNSQQILKVFRNFRGVPKEVAFSSRGKILAAAGELGLLKLWDVSSEQELPAPVLEQTAAVSSLAFSPDGNLLALPQGQSLLLFELPGMRKVAALALPEPDQVLSVAFSPDGQVLAVGYASGTIALWEMADQRLRRLLKGHTERVNSLAFAPDGQALISASADLTVRLWSVSSPPAENISRGQSKAVTCVAVSPNNQVIASGSLDGTVMLWNATTVAPIATLSAHAFPVRAVAFSPDGTRLLSASGQTEEDGWPFQPGDAKVWDVHTHREVGRLAGITNVVRSVAFSPSGTIAALAAPYAAELWDVVKGRPLGMLAGTRQNLSEWVTSVAFSPDGKTLAVGDYSDSIELWDISSRKETAQLTGLANGAECLAFSPNGQLLASGGRDLIVSLWDVRRRKRIAQLPGHKVFTVSAVAFAPDGRTLASCGWDGAVKLWNVASRRELTTFTSTAERALCLVFSGDGGRLVSGHGDGSIRLWRADSLVETVTVLGQTH
jgi:WD40 repeat protein/predicted Ser/Thr protein kinase